MNMNHPISPIPKTPPPTPSPTPPLPSSTIAVAATHSSSHSPIAPVYLRNFIIGFADGLTVPFALCAGLSSLGSAKLVILAGLAELFAGAISMGLGAYLAGVTERKRREMRMKKEERGPDKEEEEISGEEEKKEEERRERVWVEGLVMGVAYFVGGLLPMIPYFAFESVKHALFTSVAITAVILIVFGYVKSLVAGTTHQDAAWSAVQTLIIGATAAAVSYGIVRGVNSAHSI